MAETPIIIKKVKKGKGHGHHGGIWKLAYADFMTAMMAFFLLMWLLGSTSKEVREGIAEYFQNPWKASLTGGQNVGDRTSIIQGGGIDLLSREDGQVDRGGRTEEEFTAAQSEGQAEQQEMQDLEKLEAKIASLLERAPELNAFKDQIELESTHEGLRIQIVDSRNRPMFKLASSETEAHVKMILKKLAPVINELPNKITINGHTDALPFPDNPSGYSNWELSTDRANAARRELNSGGLAEQKTLRVIGLGSSIPLKQNDPSAPMNRRISIIVMKKKIEQQIQDEAGGFPGVTIRDDSVSKQLLESDRSDTKSMGSSPRRVA
ncbi:MAG: flagellar motor protein MotB [Methylococcales bacterium]